jgi:WS/DGAT/MGAT family acyltransferase
MTENTTKTGWSRNREMTELEATMWRANKHPSNSTQGGVLEILGSSPSWETMVQWNKDGIDRFPRFKEKVVEPAVPVGPPVWVEDADFNLTNHLSHVTLDGPGTMRQLLDVVQEIALQPLDPHRPPWSGTYIEGLEGGRSAYFLVVSHCLMDGHGSVQLLDTLHRTEGEGPAAVPSQRRTPSGVDVAVGQTLDRVRATPKMVGKSASALVNAIKAGPRQNAGFLGSVARVMAPPPSSTSPLFTTGERTKWSYGVLDVPLADLKAAGKAVGGTVNDAYVAAVLGGLRRYHDLDGLQLDDININMPVSVRRSNDAEGGNKFAAAFVSAPASIVDPHKRVLAVGEMSRRASAEPALDFFSLVLPVLNRAPAAVLTPLFTTMQNRTDLTISNVPGAVSPGEIAGARVDEVYYFGPLPGSPVMSVLHSHLGNCYIGLNVDGDVFEIDRLVDCVRAGFDEVLALGRT